MVYLFGNFLKKFIQVLDLSSARRNRLGLICFFMEYFMFFLDLMYQILPTSEEAADELSGDEVFLSDECATYYNYSPSRTNPRRHSIGTFMGRERSSSVASSSKSFKEDFPQAIVHATSDGDSVIIDDHSLRHASYPRKRCPRCTRGKFI